MTSHADHTDDKRAAEKAEAKKRSSPSGRVVYQAVLKEAEEELERPSSALFWSGLAAGLSMGFTPITVGLLNHHLPDSTWTPLVAKFGYAAGFVIVILGRQQLFTENTLTPMLPLLHRKDGQTLFNMLRLWSVVLLANLLGGLLIAWVLVRTNAFDAATRNEFLKLGEKAISPGFGTIVLRGIFAGWLIAMLVWMLPYSQSAHFFVIVLITWIIGITESSHVIVGAIEGFMLSWAGERSWLQSMGSLIVPALIGNIIGGVLLVAALNYAQVVSGETHAKKESLSHVS